MAKEKAAEGTRRKRSSTYELALRQCNKLSLENKLQLIKDVKQSIAEDAQRLKKQAAEIEQAIAE